MSDDINGSASESDEPWVAKLEHAKAYKKNGNDKYKSKAYRQAIGQYHRALLYLKGIDQAKLPGFLGLKQDAEVPPDVLTEVKQLKADCYNNLAACILQSDPPAYEKIVHYCDEVLVIKPENTKALYRRGVALYHLKNIEDALQTFQEAQQLPEGSKDPNIQRYLSTCQKLLAKQDEQVKKMYQGMFNA